MHTRRAGQGPIVAAIRPAVVAEEEVKEVRNLPADVAGKVHGGHERPQERRDEARGKTLKEGEEGVFCLLPEEGLQEGKRGLEAGRILFVCFALRRVRPAAVPPHTHTHA